MEKTPYEAGDVIRMKKPHPFSNKEGKITRTGMDFGLKREGCGHFVMMPRTKCEEMVHGILRPAAEDGTKEKD